MQEEKEEIDEPKTEEDNKNDHEEEDYEKKDIIPEKNEKENETEHKKEAGSLEHKENDGYTMMLEDIENDDDHDVESIIDDINMKKGNQENNEKVDKETEKSYIMETNLENQANLENQTNLENETNLESQTNLENQTKLEKSAVRKGLFSC